MIENQKSSQNEFNRFNRATSVVSRKNAFLGASVGWFSYSTFVAFISAIVMLVFFSHALSIYEAKHLFSTRAFVLVNNIYFCWIYCRPKNELLDADLS
nr:hypothetical protein [Mycoplasmopsis bovis]